MKQHYDAPLRDAANHVALSPLSFLKRAETVYAGRPAVTYGDTRRTWGQTGARCRSVAAGLMELGVRPGDTVSVLSPNIPELFELHYAVPLLGAVLNTINTRLEPETVAYILNHSDSTLVIADTALAPLLRQAFEINGKTVPVVDIIDVADAVIISCARAIFQQSECTFGPCLVVTGPLQLKPRLISLAGQ